MTLQLNRDQIVQFRQNTGLLTGRVQWGGENLRKAAWAGLQDSVPRAALLSLHARLEGVASDSWEAPELCQVWGPRFSSYVVPKVDVAIYTVSRLPDSPAKADRCHQIADQIERVLGDQVLEYGEVAQRLGVNSNQLRYGGPTGRLRIRWEGAGKPLIWMVPPPQESPVQARLEAVRRYLHVFGPSTPVGFAEWLGVGRQAASQAFTELSGELAKVETPDGAMWMMAADLGDLGHKVAQENEVRFLPSGDSYWLLSGGQRELLIPDPKQRDALWTPRVWPGALLYGGEVVGTWRRASSKMVVSTWAKAGGELIAKVEAAAHELPLPASDLPVVVKWE